MENNTQIDPSTLSMKELSALLAEKRKEAEAERDAARALAQDNVASATQAILQVQPAEPSDAEGATWVGSILGGFEVEIEGVKYSVAVHVKDVEASKKRREARQAAAKRAVA